MKELPKCAVLGSMIIIILNRQKEILNKIFSRDITSTSYWLSELLFYFPNDLPNDIFQTNDEK